MNEQSLFQAIFLDLGTLCSIPEIKCTKIIYSINEANIFQLEFTDV